ncbi:hypothetical protein FHS78_003574 [Parvibaculum indicum]|uniref:hypothetical protein n=1 Tax=Parvibaculum indicum TaxID=562969 RepID=UPI00141F96EF|nr:hypothetical protein [Parvibaculum indicum]NIJ43262.1 hypothetical protein [Parvibaculum indicum]
MRRFSFNVTGAFSTAMKKDYKKGKVSAEKARERIHDAAGGINLATWVLVMGEKDPVVEALERYKVPVTRSNWIKFSYPDGPPKPWTAEHEAELPEELQLKSKEDGSIFNEM